MYLIREESGDILDIYKLRMSLVQLLQPGPDNERTCIDDFVLMISLLGNDFLPHIPSLVNMEQSINTFVDVYSQLKKPLTRPKDAEIIWENFSEFLRLVSDREQGLLIKLAETPFVHRSFALDKASEKMRVLVATTASGTGMSGGSFGGQTVVDPRRFDLAVYRSGWYNHIFGYRGDKAFIEQVAAAIGKSYDDFNRPFDINDVKQAQTTLLPMCQRYFDNLAWVYRYYRRGTEGISMTMYYPYHYTPLLSDLYHASVLYNPNQTLKFKPSKDDTPFQLVDQLVAILPRKSFNLIPDAYEIIKKEFNKLSDLFPITFTIDRELTNEDWQGTALIPFIDMDRIVGETTSVYGLPKEKSSRLVWVLTDEQRVQRATELELKRDLGNLKRVRHQARQDDTSEPAVKTYDLRIDIDGIGFVPMIERPHTDSKTVGSVRGRGLVRGRGRGDFTSAPPTHEPRPLRLQTPPAEASSRGSRGRGGVTSTRGSRGSSGGRGFKSRGRGLMENN